MEFIRHILRFWMFILFTALGANMAFAVPMVASDISYFPTETTHFSQTDVAGFAARAPPLAASSVPFTGDVTVMQGGAFSLRGQETVAALFGFGGDLNATNSRPNLWNSPLKVVHQLG